MLMAAAGSDAGILFRSYEVPAEHRTAIVLSASHGKALTFNDSLAFSFSLKADLDKGKFGYVFRLAVDDMQSVDFLLSPEGGKPVYCITADHQNVVAVNGLVENVGEWNDIYVYAVERRDSIVLFMNDAPVAALHSSRKRHKAKIFFGKVDEPGLVTSDVAPMTIADLKVSCDGGNKSASWMLSGIEDIVPKHGIALNVSNPVFISGLRDRWTKMWSSDLPSTSYICISQDTAKFYIISSDQIIEYDIASGKDATWTYSTDIDLRRVTGEFLCMPDGSLCYADMETGKLIRYDNIAKDWTASNAKERMSVHLHHNVVYMDTTCFQMFGYGQHRYSSEVFVWTPACGLVDLLDIDGLAPRYLAGAASKDGKIYVLGGKGNISGHQELGTQYYDTFTEIEPVSGTARDLWNNPILNSLVPAKDLVFTDDGKSFLALLYNTETNESSLQLTRFNTLDGTSEALLPPLPYRFTDIYSDARLCYNKDRDIYLAILCYKAESGQDKADVYILGNPIAPTAVHNIGNAVVPLTFLVLLSFAGFWFIWRKRLRIRQPEGAISVVSDPLESTARGGQISGETGTGLEKGTVNTPAEKIDSGKRPGIHFLGGFHVFDTGGAEITAYFSPILVQLLSILVLYTAEKGGVSNATLKDILWPDKSDDRFNNNKGVNITKLRKLLSMVGDIPIVTDGRLWMIKDTQCLCDYMTVKQRLHNGTPESILTAAMAGPLLPEYHFEWLDAFKSEYTDIVISCLADIPRLTDIPGAPPSPERMIQIAEARLKFDFLDEDAVRLKCQALISLSRTGTAKSVFGYFSEEYAAVMGEPLGINFSDFLKNKSH